MKPLDWVKVGFVALVFIAIPIFGGDWKSAAAWFWILLAALAISVYVRKKTGSS